jgi:hypothetical protein
MIRHEAKKLIVENLEELRALASRRGPEPGGKELFYFKLIS